MKNQQKYIKPKIDWNKIKTNPVILCKKCNTYIQSQHRHDYCDCECGDVAIDGGSYYTKVNYAPDAMYEFIKEAP